MDIRTRINTILNISKYEYHHLMSLQNVRGVGYGYKHVNGVNTFTSCIHVLVEKKLDSKFLLSNQIIPRYHKGIITDVIEIGNPKQLSLTDRIRPLEGGYAISATGQVGNSGTIGCIVTKGTLFKDYYILSNNHVMAGNNTFKIGTPIIQTAARFGGSAPKDTVANLSKFVPIGFESTSENLMDAAIAKLTDKAFASNRIALTGKVKGVGNPKLNLEVRKVGITTGASKGKIITMGASLHVECGDKYAFFVDQIVSDNSCGGGDSGATVLNLNNEIVGLLFAGSSSKCIFSNIKDVMKAFKIDIYK